jgi:hypothetical protein
VASSLCGVLSFRGVLRVGRECVRVGGGREPLSRGNCGIDSRGAPRLGFYDIQTREILEIAAILVCNLVTAREWLGTLNSLPPCDILA